MKVFTRVSLIAVAAAMGLAATAASVQAATIAAWNFDSLASGNTVATDISGNSQDLSFYKGGSSPVSALPMSLANADPHDASGAESTNKSLVFPTMASPNYPYGINFATAASLNLSANNAFTIEGWINPSQYPNYKGTLLGVGGGSGATAYQFVLGMKQGGQIAGQFYSAAANAGAGVNVQPGGTSVAPLNSWTHLAMTYDGSALKLYVNGNLESTTAISNAPVPSIAPSAIYVMHGYAFNDSYGSIDDLRISNVALSPAQLDYHQSLTPEPGSLSMLAVGGLMLIRRRRRS